MATFQELDAIDNAYRIFFLDLRIKMISKFHRFACHIELNFLKIENIQIKVVANWRKKKSSVLSRLWFIKEPMAEIWNLTENIQNEKKKIENVWKSRRSQGFHILKQNFKIEDFISRQCHYFNLISPRCGLAQFLWEYVLQYTNKRLFFADKPYWYS